MSEVKRYDMRVSLGGVESYESLCGDYVDYDDYAALEAKCAALAAELKQSRIDAYCYKKGMEASNARLVQLAAENAALKSGAMDEIEVINRGGQAYCVKDGVQVNPMYARGWNDYRAKSLQSDTPATDAFLAEVRAQGVKSLSNAVQSVIAERQRHQSVEGWTPEHDDQYSKSQLLWASSCYVLNAIHPFNRIPFDWPWTPEWWKPTNPRRDLVKAGALILAEIERIDRQEAAQ